MVVVTLVTIFLDTVECLLDTVECNYNQSHKILSALALDFDRSRKQVHVLKNCQQFICMQ